MKIAFIIATLNRAHMIAAAVESVLRNDLCGEVIVVDDCSEQDLPAALAHINDPRLKYTRLSVRSGPAGARNAGVALAQSELIAIIDSDELLADTDLSVVTNYFMQDDDLFCVQTPCRSLSTGALMARVYPEPKRVEIHSFFNGEYCGEYQCFFRRSMLDNPAFYAEPGVIRECTALTYMRYVAAGRKMIIINYVTRLYGDANMDRLSLVPNVLRDAGQIYSCYQKIDAEFGAILAEAQPNTYARLLMYLCYYGLLSAGRATAWTYWQRMINTRFMLPKKVGLFIFIAIGPSATIFLRKVFSYVR